MKILLTTMGLVELGAGLAVWLLPSQVVFLLLAAPLEGDTAKVIVYLAGAALVSLGLACFMARSADWNFARGTILAMLVYNFAATVVFLGARLHYGLGGLVLWIVIVAHGLLGIWCAALLRRNRTEPQGGSDPG